MKKRILSALLVLALACGLVSTAWANDEVQAVPTQEPAAQTVEVDPAEVATSENAATPVPDEETADDAGAEDTATTEDTDSIPSQPNRAPMAAAPALQAETRATANEFKVYWWEEWRVNFGTDNGQESVTVQLYNTDGEPITGDVADITFTNKENVDFTTANANKVIPDIPGYRYTGAEYRLDNGNWTSFDTLKITHDWVQNGWISSNKWCWFVNGNQLSQMDKHTLIVRLNYEETGLGIVDSVNTDGKFTAQFTDPSIAAGAEVTYTWYRCATDSKNPEDWTEIVKTKIAGDLYNMEADNGTANATSVNVSLDSDKKAANTADNQKYWYKVVATVAKGGETKTYEATRQVPYFVALQNGSFEIPERDGYGGEDTGVYTDVPGFEWKTTAKHDYIELIRVDKRPIWENTNSETYHHWGLWETADEGYQVVELNAKEKSTLYQDVLTIPGTKLNWSLAHRARSHWNGGNIKNASDTMYVVIMPVSEAQELQTQDDVDALIKEAEDSQQIVDNTENVVQTSDGKTACIWKITDWTEFSGNNNITKWNNHTGTYVVGNNEYATRFFFSAGPTATGDQTVGNLLDNVSFGKDVPKPNEDEVTVRGTKTVVGLDTLPQDYKVTVTVSNGAGETLGTQELAGSQFQQDDGNWVAEYAIQRVKIPADAQSYKITVKETVSGQPDSSQYTETAQVSCESDTKQADSIDLQVTGGQVYTVAFTNTYTQKTADLTITKTFVGLDEEKANQVWNALGFTVASKGSTLTPTIDKEGKVTASGNTFTATATIKDLTIGQPYTITEAGAELEGYTLNTVAKVNEEGNNAAATIEALAQGTSVSFTNTYEPATSSLTITKLVTGDDNRAGNFDITVTGPTELANQTLKDSEGNDVAFDASATATVTLSDEESITIMGLPRNKTYTVQEAESSQGDIDLDGGATAKKDYYLVETKYQIDSGNVTPEKAEVELTDDKNVTVTNTYKPYKTLTVEKIVTGEMGSSSDYFDFSATKLGEDGESQVDVTLVGADTASDSVNYDFKLKSGGTVTIVNLKEGDEVTISEAANDNRGYTAKEPTLTLSKDVNAERVSNVSVKVTVPGGDGTVLGKVTFNNEREAVAPTGLESNHTAPYTLMITAVGIAGLALIGSIVARRVRRRREE